MAMKNGEERKICFVANTHSHSPFNCSFSILLEFPVDTGYDVKSSTNTFTSSLCFRLYSSNGAYAFCGKRSCPRSVFAPSLISSSLMPSFVDDDDDGVFPVVVVVASEAEKDEEEET